MSPDLERERLRRFERWLDDAIGRHAPPLSFSELRKGVQALSSLYVERRAAGPIAPRARDGHGKRAAFATYYAALHFLTAHHALQQIGAQRFGDVRRVHDLGCGTASAGAAIASGLPGAPDVRASDAAGWVLSEARHTLAAFGIPGTVRRAPLRAALARARGGDLVLFAWVLNELSDATRDETVRGLQDACRRGCRLLVLEPLARPACPWWPDLVRDLRPEGVRELPLKLQAALPPWISKMDRAAGLDHRTLGARVLAGPLDAEKAASPRAALRRANDLV